MGSRHVAQLFRPVARLVQLALLVFLIVKPIHFLS
ncbi:Uncharacterised protein [Salmonella enterica subsp. enterica]|nr:Uncharacterised protein [Salmonella enterica subsp. enterica] [Salmonella enterica subsp. enterica serovar Menston]